MHVRQLLDWRKLLIYSHRWLGIIVGGVLVAWCLSGVVLMYYGTRLWPLGPSSMLTLVSRLPLSIERAHSRGCEATCRNSRRCATTHNLERPATYTRLPALQTHFPLHRVALDDAAGTEYYVSERSGEAVMKSDRRTRLLELFGYITHTFFFFFFFFFFRQQSWWSALLQWVSWIGLTMRVPRSGG
jgi:hypothetical protein